MTSNGWKSENRKNQDRLEELLDPNAQISEVNIESSRTPNIIRNFAIGEDVLLLPRSSERQQKLRY